MKRGSVFAEPLFFGGMVGTKVGYFSPKNNCKTGVWDLKWDFKICDFSGYLREPFFKISA